MTSWLATSPDQKYGGAFINSQQKATPDRSELPTVAAPAVAGGKASPLSPQSALFWVGVIAAASVGLMAYSTSARVGPVSASLNVGK
jgi:hypothetical protein